MANRPKPISASNPPDSRGERLPKDVTPLAGEEEGVERQSTEVVEEGEQVVHQPTAVEPSPAKKTTTSKKTTATTTK